MGKEIKIILVDDHQSFVQGIASALKSFPKFSIIGSANNGAELLEKLETISPDVIVLDLAMPILSGEDALPILLNRYPEIKIVLLSMDFYDTLIDYYFEK